MNQIDKEAHPPHVLSNALVHSTVWDGAVLGRTKSTLNVYDVCMYSLWMLWPCSI